MEVNTMFNSNCASVPLVASIDGGYGGNNGFLNGDGLWGLIIILALLGWGGNGFGFGGGFGGGRGSVEPCATQADVRAAVEQQTLISKLDNQTYGLADSTYALNNTITNGFHGVDNAICTLGYQTQSGFNALGHQISDCCCQTQRAIDGVRYDMATQACDTRHAIQDSTRQILDFLTTDKIASLQAENQSLKFKASQAEQNAFITANQQAQTAELIRRLGADCPVNAYVVQPPTPVTFPVNCCGQFNGYGYGNSCGCGCA
jgi:hypothetical protein